MDFSGWDWKVVSIIAIDTIGLTNWVKGFTLKFVSDLNGNVLRLVQVAIAIGLAFLAILPIPIQVFEGITAVAFTTLYKTDIVDFGSYIFGSKKTVNVSNSSGVTDEINNSVPDKE